MTRILLTRHGHVDGIKPARFRGPTELALAERGLAQMARARDVLREVLSRFLGQTVVLLGHDSVNRVLLMQLFGMPLAAYWRLVQGPCTLNEIEVSAAGVVSVRRVNDTSQLDQAGVGA